ncbi:MAG TPA: NifB/NifX family molybdenum-iron cluster-binding protein [Acidimicrobiales bacterium]|nr:NifB/NifX family molybdenum-iron cluster-binding protein [Acidimicrobiales bacterium]
MIACVPVMNDGVVDPRWGRADWIAVAEVRDGAITSWEEFEVSWSRLHDEGSGARHHARIARFLKEHQIEAVVADHVGDGMVKMLGTMKLALYLGASGDARAAVLAALHA